MNTRPVSASAARMFHPHASPKEQELLAELMTSQADLVMSRNDNAVASKQLARSGALLLSEPCERPPAFGSTRLNLALVSPRWNGLAHGVVRDGVDGTCVDRRQA